MNWLVVILRFLLGICQPKDDSQLQPVAVRPDGTTCHPDPEDDSRLSVSCRGWFKLRRQWLSSVCAEKKYDQRLDNIRQRHCRRNDRRRSFLE